jgi:anti-sigma regulatory factor (Ser/Thr protein kinase)
MSSDPTVKEGGRGLRLVKETMELVSLHTSNGKFSLTFEMIA